MANDATIGYGSTLEYGDSSAGPWTKLAEVLDEMTGPGMEVDSVECTHMESPDAFREYKPGLASAGELSVTLNKTPAILNILYGLVRTKKWWRESFGFDGTATDDFICEGFWTSLEPSAPKDDKQTLDLTIQLTGKPTYSTT